MKDRMPEQERDVDFGPQAKEQGLKHEKVSDTCRAVPHKGGITGWRCGGEKRAGGIKGGKAGLDYNVKSLSNFEEEGIHVPTKKEL